LASTRDLEHYRAIIEIISDSLYMIRDIYDRKAFLVSASSEIDKVRWQGLPLLLKEPLQEMVNRLGDAMSYAFAIKFLGAYDIELAKSYIRELTLRLDEIAEWEYDKVASLLEASLATHHFGLIDESNNALEMALSLISSIPDRSDRSIALAQAVKVLTIKGRFTEAIGLIDQIYYEPKRIEAVYNVIDNIEAQRLNNQIISALESKLSDFEVPIFRAKLAYKIATLKPNTSKSFCIKLLTKANFDRPLGLREIISYRWCIKTLILVRENNFVDSILERYIDALLLRIDEREAIKAIRDLILAYHQMFNSSETLANLINKVVNQVSVEETTNKQYILNRLANLKWYIGLKNDAIYMFKNNFMEANKLEHPISTYTIIDIGVNALEITNNFPSDLDPDTVLAVKGALLPAERQSIEISISREHLKFLKSESIGMIGVYIEKLLNKETIEKEMTLNKKAKEFILTLIGRGQQIVLHYILKYIYQVPMSEHERTNFLNLIGRAVELMTRGLKDEALPYVELILDKLERLGYPLYAIPIELLHNYILQLM